MYLSGAIRAYHIHRNMPKIRASAGPDFTQRHNSALLLAHMRAFPFRMKYAKGAVFPKTRI
jgi:hypothetical protein